MGGVMSCIKNLFRTVGNAIMAVISGIGNILHAIINGVVGFINILVSFFTCGYCGKKRHGTSAKHRMGSSRRSRV